MHRRRKTDLFNSIIYIFTLQMPKGLKTLEQELKDLEYKLEYHAFLKATGAEFKLPTIPELEERIKKTKAAIEKLKA